MSICTSSGDETWNYLSTTSLPVLAPAGRLCLPPPLPLTADPPQSLFPLALHKTLSNCSYYILQARLLRQTINQGLDVHVSPQRILPPPLIPSTKPKTKNCKRKKKTKSCKPGITTEQNRTRGGDADGSRDSFPFVPCSFPQTARGTVHVVITCISYLLRRGTSYLGGSRRQ